MKCLINIFAFATAEAQHRTQKAQQQPALPLLCVHCAALRCDCIFYTKSNSDPPSPTIRPPCPPDLPSPTNNNNHIQPSN
ncbi:hypothetical protein Cob_v002114 [Colletotrichum orbiculare MAFF 240422]|uniref:Uncharacterized protein n=1 Tax=Colletotrichum orbiculare (strain 104-T / ATCC 96160 / CBS 514.97 / LARS 414 / MAFF 240422) TaxID=1213857 RepID=A0A484G678_COLOR|nr:hypothetical protein Cob_v002114 [Colletotrichum orbiculare MAFF 240422]